MTKVICEVINQKGMHARAAAKIVATVTSFDSQTTLTLNKRSAPANSLIKLLTLNAPKGSMITIESAGPEGEQSLHALQQLFLQKFDE